MFMKKAALSVFILLLLCPKLFSADLVENPNYKEFYKDWNWYTTTKDPWKSRQFVYDSNYVRWAYDVDTGTLQVSYGVFFTNTPNEDYFIDMVVGNQLGICEQKLEYKSFYMIWECEVKIKNEDIVWEYKLKNLIKNSEWEILRGEILKFNVSGYDSGFSWKNIQIDSLDSESSNQNLIISWWFYWGITELYDTFELRLYELNDNFSKKRIQWDKIDLRYNSEKSVLEFKWELEKFWPEDKEKIYYEVIDKNNKVIWKWDFVHISQVGNDEEIDWRAFKTGLEHNQEENYWNLRVHLWWIDLKPRGTYSIVIDTKGGPKKYKWELLYDNSKKELYILIKYEGSRDKQSFTYKIQWSTWIKIAEGNLKLGSANNRYTLSKQNTINKDTPDSKQVKDKTKLELAIDDFVEKQKEKYPNTWDLVKRLEEIQIVFTTYAKKNVKYTSVVEEINKLIQWKIEQLQ